MSIPKATLDSRDQMSALVTRAITAGVLALFGAELVWAGSGLLLPLVGRMDEPLASIVAAHGLPALPIGAYFAAAAPYGWAVVRDFLRPSTRQQIQSRPPLRSAVLATLAIGPFIAPYGVIRDVARYRELRRELRDQRARVAARVISPSARRLSERRVDALDASRAIYPNRGQEFKDFPGR